MKSIIEKDEGPESGAVRQGGLRGERVMIGKEWRDVAGDIGNRSEGGDDDETDDELIELGEEWDKLDPEKLAQEWCQRSGCDLGEWYYKLHEVATMNEHSITMMLTEMNKRFDREDRLMERLIVLESNEQCNELTRYKRSRHILNRLRHSWGFIELDEAGLDEMLEVGLRLGHEASVVDEWVDEVRRVKYIPEGDVDGADKIDYMATHDETDGLSNRTGGVLNDPGLSMMGDILTEVTQDVDTYNNKQLHSLDQLSIRIRSVNPLLESWGLAPYIKRLKDENGPGVDRDGVG